MTLNKIYNMGCMEGMKQLPDRYVNCCVTSPPYWGLRDYGVAGQYGLESTPDEFIAKQVEVFREVRRVLKDDGTCWINIGDSYAHNGAAYGNKKSTLTGRKHGEEMGKARRFIKRGNGLKPKDLVGIPWMLAFALRADGWYLRDCIIWHKPNPMPESVTDRTTKAHEYIFLLSKSPKYYYDNVAIREPAKPSSIRRWAQNVDGQKGSSRVPGKTNGAMKAVGGPRTDKQRGHSRQHAGFNERWDSLTKADQQAMGANKRSVWTIATQPFKEAHFATFPEALPATCIKAGCPEGGIVLDPYMGAGSTALVAWKMQRQFIGIELNPEYVSIAERRLARAKKVGHQIDLIK